MAPWNITLQASMAGPVWTTHSSPSVQKITGQIPSCVLNDPVEDMWSDVLWADMVKLAQNGTTAWLHSKCCFSSFANVFHLALQKTYLIEVPFLSCGTQKNGSVWKQKKLWVWCGKISDQRNSSGRNMIRRGVVNISCFIEHGGLMRILAEALLRVRGVGFLRCLWAPEQFFFFLAKSS